MTHRWSEQDSNCWSPSKEMLASATIRLASAPLVGAKKQHSCREGPVVRIRLPPAKSQLRTQFQALWAVSSLRCRCSQGLRAARVPTGQGERLASQRWQLVPGS
jgi:hypothetical protein